MYTTIKLLQLYIHKNFSSDCMQEGFFLISLRYLIGSKRESGWLENVIVSFVWFSICVLQGVTAILHSQEHKMLLIQPFMPYKKGCIFCSLNSFSYESGRSQNSVLKLVVFW